MTSLSIIDQNASTRMGLAHMLGQSGYRISGLFSDYHALYTQGSLSDILIFNKKHDVCALGQIIPNIKRKLHRDTKIACLGKRLSLKDLNTLIHAGIDGYIHDDISEDGLKTALHIIALGEKFYPAVVIEEYCRSYCEEKENPSVHKTGILSKREREILSGICEGKTNKSIADKLDIAEATVKVHVKRILKRLNLENRTQIAIWALKD